MYLNYPIVKCRDGSTAFPQKARRHINVKVEFGKGEGKVPLDNIAKRAEGYKPKERVTYKMIKEYIEAKLGKNQNVTLPVLLSICEYLKCDFGDIMEAVPEIKEQ